MAFANLRRRLLVTCLVLFATAGSALAQPAPARAPDIYYEPTPANVVAEIVALAGVREGDVVYDLGCGDGRIVIQSLTPTGLPT